MSNAGNKKLLTIKILTSKIVARLFTIVESPAMIRRAPNASKIILINSKMAESRIIGVRFIISSLIIK